MAYQPIPPHGPLSVDFGEGELPACDVPLRYAVPILLFAPLGTAALVWAGGFDRPGDVRTAFLPVVVVEYLLLGGVVWSLRRRGVGLVVLGLTTEEWRREVPIGVVVGFVLLVTFPAVSWVVGLALPSSSGLGEARPAWHGWAYTFALVTTFAPVEEIVWRGFAIATLRRRIGVVAAVAASSAAFGVHHWWGGPALVVTAALFGLVLAGLYVWRGRLLAPIVAHLVAGLPLVWLPTARVW